MLDLNQDVDMPNAYGADDTFFLGGPDDDDQWEDVPTGLRVFPPGEEAMLQSHAGGEAVFHQIMERIRPGCAVLAVILGMY